MQHSVWHKVPVVRILLSFASGIGTSMFCSFGLHAVLLIMAVPLLTFVCIPFFIKGYQYRWLPGVAAVALFYCSGIFVHVYQNPLSYSSHFSYRHHIKQYVVMLDEEPVEKAHSFKVKLKVLEAIDSLGETHAVTGKILLYIDKKEALRLPQYGDVILIQAAGVHEVSVPKNPLEFDYKRYLAFNHIHHQCYSKVKNLLITDLNLGSQLMKSVYRIQHYFKQTLDTYVKTPGEVGVAQALLYGIDDHIDEATMSAYANTGTLHVLAVSGMHVGLILVILNHALFFMDQNKRLLLIKRILIIVSLWIYSALCGLSPSILRATVMFTFIIVSQMLERKSNIYNTLAASCLVLLFVDSNMLANVGFQLSYMAVLGIIFLQPLIQAWYTPGTWLGRQIWSITSVSVAAQLATSPIGILYFHQFPFCFLFSNLLIIPLTTVIIYIAIGLLVFSWWPWAAACIGYFIRELILFTNGLVMWVERIPYSYQNGLQISIFQSIMLYVLLLCLVFYFMYRYTTLLKLSLIAVFCFTGAFGLEYYVRSQRKQLVVYSISKSNVIHVIDGASSRLFIDEEIRYDRQKFRFHLQQHIWYLGLTRIDTLPNNKTWQQLDIQTKRIVLSGENNADVSPQPDILILRNQVMPEKLAEVNPKLLVISGAVKHWQSKKIVEFCTLHNIPVYDVLDSGAYQLILY